jgi:hypothetical protein
MTGCPVSQLPPVHPLPRPILLQALLPGYITGVRVKKLLPALYPDEPVFEFVVAPSGLQTMVDTTVAAASIAYDPYLSLRRGDTFLVQATFLPRDNTFYAAQVGRCLPTQAWVRLLERTWRHSHSQCSNDNCTSAATVTLARFQVTCACCPGQVGRSGSWRRWRRSQRQPLGLQSQ